MDIKNSFKLLDKIDDFLIEYDIIKGSAGRTVSAQSGFVWMYISNPRSGLLWADKNGVIYLDSRKLTKIDDWDSRKDTHKKLLAVVWDLVPKFQLSKNKRADVDKIVDTYDTDNPRGRIVGDVVYVYDYPSGGKYTRMVDQAIDAIYDYIP